MPLPKKPRQPKLLVEWLSSPPILITLAIILIGISILEFRQWRKRHQIQKEIEHITQQQAEYQQKNQDLADSLNLLNTQNYKEKVAREQLSLQKKGEIVVNFSTASSPPAQNASVAQQTNPQKWWQYFFNKN